MWLSRSHTWLEDSIVARKKPKSKAGKRAKVAKVIEEFNRGELRSGGSGKKVTSRRQALAIAMSEAGLQKKKKSKKKRKKK